MIRIYMRRMSGIGGGPPGGIGKSQSTEENRNPSDKLMHVSAKTSGEGNKISGRSAAYASLQDASTWLIKRHNYDSKGIQDHTELAWNSITQE